MSSPPSNPDLRSTQPAVHDEVSRGYTQPNQDLTKADEIHHLYYEDNDSFFPPAWLGKDTNPSERRSSNDSTTSHDPKD
ncbi:hypothetical protein PEBR_20647 [Penicillium brasilianum]|uniref:Uncharacterized protein n=1 Tax=Penicillium brasilianum TaxID=104259 RepID=A0A1S9RMA7_PENBI|nr:hypothetical protein PEBR_20647 [Penicillium brasilianum]